MTTTRIRLDLIPVLLPMDDDAARDRTIDVADVERVPDVGEVFTLDEFECRAFEVRHQDGEVVLRFTCDRAFDLLRHVIHKERRETATKRTPP